MFANWWIVHVVSRGAVAAFPNVIDAGDYANATRDAIGEARGSPSAVSVKLWKEFKFRFWLTPHIHPDRRYKDVTMCGYTESDAQGAAWAKVLLDNPEAICCGVTLL